MWLWSGTGAARLMHELNRLRGICFVVIASHISDFHVRMQIKHLNIFKFCEILIKFQTIVCVVINKSFRQFSAKPNENNSRHYFNLLQQLPSRQH